MVRVAFLHGFQSRLQTRKTEISGNYWWTLGKDAEAQQPGWRRLRDRTFLVLVRSHVRVQAKKDSGTSGMTTPTERLVSYLLNIVLG